MDRIKRNLDSQKGISLVEVLIVFAIVVLLVLAATGNLNPIAQVNKGYDARMKKDLARIKVAFEEYYNDRGCYPSYELIHNQWRLGDGENCNKPLSFFPWLSPWPCQPDGVSYRIVVDMSEKNYDCPSWFKVFAKLSNKNDKDVPPGWYDGEFRLAEEVTNLDANYGVSSTNVKWFQRWLHPTCVTNPLNGQDWWACYDCTDVANPQSNHLPPGCSVNCNISSNCNPACQVSSCIGVGTGGGSFEL